MASGQQETRTSAEHLSRSRSPYALSRPLSPRSTSGPLPPCSRSRPSPLRSTSGPSPPCNRSRPPRPRRTSSPRWPTMRSAALDPSRRSDLLEPWYSSRVVKVILLRVQVPSRARTSTRTPCELCANVGRSVPRLPRSRARTPSESSEAIGSGNRNTSSPGPPRTVVSRMVPPKRARKRRDHLRRRSCRSGPPRPETVSWPPMP